MAKVQIIIYSDFESVLISSTDNIDCDPKTNKYQDNIFYSYG